MPIDSFRYRLRLADKIVGFKKQIHQIDFYSKDQYAWNGKELAFEIQDPFTGYFDKNRRAIYSEDIVEFHDPNNSFLGLILFDEPLQEFQILDWKKQTLRSEKSFHDWMQTSLVWKSYHFIQGIV